MGVKLQLFEMCHEMFPGKGLGVQGSENLHTYYSINVSVVSFDVPVFAEQFWRMESLGK